MTPTKQELIAILERVNVVLRSYPDLDDDGKRHMLQGIALYKNPRAPLEETTDIHDRWAFGRKDPPGTFETFRPTLVLWADWLKWCRTTGEQPGTFPGFCARLAKKPWLRKGRTRWGKGRNRKPANGWWGIKT